MSPQTVVYLFDLVIYILIVVAFNRARIKYAGGKVGQMINIILVTVLLLFLADYIRVLGPVLPEDVTFGASAVLRAAGLAFLAFGGIRIASS